MRSKEVLNSLSKLTEREKFDDLSLTVYYLSPYTLTSFPLNVDDLVNFDGVKIIVIDGSDMEEQIGLFKQISKDDLIPVKKTSHINARIYYVFESEKEGKILDVAMWGDDNSVFINGLEVKGNDIFVNIIIPFLSEDEKNDLTSFILFGTKYAPISRCTCTWKYSNDRGTFLET
jgi:hypothetical protein